MSQITNFKYTLIPCPCCEKNEFDSLYNNHCLAGSKGSFFAWQNNTVICRNCGFIFVNPSPDSETLLKYYESALTRFVRDYSVDRRIAYLKKFVETAESFLEFGSNDSNDFHEAIRKFIHRIYTIEPNSSCKNDFDTLDNVPENIDVVGSYFVLEHILSINEFFSDVAKKIRSKGILIVELPEVRFYPKDCSSLLLHEHINHFSPRTIATFAIKHGFELLDISYEYASRPFGFVVAFRYTGKSLNPSPDKEEYLSGKAAIEGALLLIHRYNEIMDIAIDVIRKAPNPYTVVWCANDTSAHFLKRHGNPKEVLVIDKDPRKKNSIYEFKVFTPNKAMAAIRKGTHFVICSNTYAEAIKQELETIIGKAIPDENLFVIDVPTPPRYSFLKKL